MEEKEKWHFLNLYRMAMADGDFASVERKVLYELAEKKGVTREQLNDFIVSGTAQSYVPDTLEEKISMLYDLMKIAWADGKITPEERDMLKLFVKKFGFNVGELSDLISYFSKKIKDNATVNDIINEINKES